MPAVASNRQDLVRSLFAAVDDMDVDGVAAHLSDDVVLAFGSSEPVAGKAGFEQTTVAFFAALRGLRHEIGDVWQPEPDVVITEMTVHYTRLDGGQLSLPCCNTGSTWTSTRSSRPPATTPEVDDQMLAPAGGNAPRDHAVHPPLPLADAGP